MYTPPPDPRHRPTDDEYTWKGVSLVFAALGFVPVALVTVSQPLIGGLFAAVTAGLFVGTGGVIKLTRCLRYCGEFTLALRDNVEVTVTRSARNGCCSVD